jgi:hypothetical protein
MILQNHVAGTRLVSNLTSCFVAVYAHQLVPFLHAIPQPPGLSRLHTRGRNLFGGCMLSSYLITAKAALSIFRNDCVEQG